LLDFHFRMLFGGIEIGVERSRKAVHDWVNKCDLQPVDDENPNHVR